jgi:hypothetical protein
LQVLGAASDLLCKGVALIDCQAKKVRFQLHSVVILHHAV